MKVNEEGSDHVVSTFKVPVDGWHKCQFKTGIDYLPAGKGQEGYYQDDKGNKALKLPCVVADPDDPDDGGQVNILVNMGSQQKLMTGILICVGLWEAVKKRFPDPNVSVFDPPVVEGIKLKLPELFCMIKTRVDKKGNCVHSEIASFAKYKEILAEEKAKGKKKGTQEAAVPEEAAKSGGSAPTGDGW